MKEWQLEQLFNTCDKEGKGYIEKEGLQELCAGLGISKADSASIFSDLDLDRDGHVSFKEFVDGFKQICAEGNGEAQRRLSVWCCQDEKPHSDASSTASSSNISMTRTSSATMSRGDPKRRRGSEWTSLSQNLTKINKLSLRHEEDEKIRLLCEDLEAISVPPEEATRIENVFSTLLCELQEMHSDKKSIEEMHKKEKELHSRALKSLEEELEQHLKKAEEKARNKSQQQTEEEWKRHQDQVDEEISRLQEYLKLFQKVDSWLRKEDDNEKLKEFREKLEDANYSNRSLKMELQETSTNLALLRAEMAQNKQKYEEKCKELHMEREHVLEYIHRYDSLRRQVQMLQSRSPKSFMLQQGDGGIHKFGIKRLMEDLDSGLSTLPDLTHQSELKEVEELVSLEEELVDVFSGESETESTKTSSQLHCKEPDKRWPAMSFVQPYGTPLALPDRAYKVVFAGDVAVGKSTFIMRLCHGSFIPNLSSTLGVDYKVTTIGVDDKNVTVQLWDTAGTALIYSYKNILTIWCTLLLGQERFRSMTKAYFRRADGVMLVYDVTSEKSFLSVRHWIQNIKESCDYGVPIMLCGNKVDLRDTARLQGASVVLTSDGRRLAEEVGVSFTETSSKTGARSSDAILELAREMVTSEDVAVKTSALQLEPYNSSKKRCCLSKS